jgi:hypothetical protein
MDCWTSKEIDDDDDDDELLSPLTGVQWLCAHQRIRTTFAAFTA